MAQEKVVIGRCSVKFLVDECLSPRYVHELVRLGHPDTVHPIHIGLLGTRDDTILTRAFADDRILITANARDFRRLLAEMPIHPGAMIIEPLEFDLTWQQIVAALAFIELHPRPEDYMVNRVVEVSAVHGIVPYEIGSKD
jgi:predicted nuclease of predicted toxin-antitoxin system